MRLIDADPLMAIGTHEDAYGYVSVEDIANAPTIEPKCADGCIYGWGSDECEKCRFKCEPKTGHWHITDAYPHNVYCSECYTRFAQTHWAVWEDGSLPRNYCPNCGARMEDGK